MSEELNPQAGTEDVSVVGSTEDLGEYLAARDKQTTEAKPEGEVETSAESETAIQEEPEAKPEGEAEEEEESEEEKPDASDGKKKKGGFQRTIAKLNSEKQELQRQLEEAKRLADKPAEKPASGSDEPKEDDFESIAEYTKALTRWTLAQERKAEAESEKATRNREKVADFRKAHPDYDSVLEEFPDDILLHEQVAAAISESENPPALMYALSKDIDMARQIAAASPLAGVLAIGRLEASLTPAAPPKVKPISAAPKPITSVTGKGGRSVGPSIADAGEDFRAYKRIMGRN